MAKAKAKATARKSARTASARGRSPQAAMPRSMHNRGTGDMRKAVQTPRNGKSAREARGGSDALTRVTHETEVRGTETNVANILEFDHAASPTVSSPGRRHT